MGWSYNLRRACCHQWEPDAVDDVQIAPSQEGYAPIIPMPQNDEVRVPPAADGRVYVNAEIDGVPFTALADNGANTIVISHPLAKALGIHWSKADLNTNIETSGGVIRGVTFTLPAITVEGVLHASDLDVTIREHDTGRNIIGKPFWDQFNVLFEKGTMIVRP